MNNENKKAYVKDLKVLPLGQFEVFEEDGLKCLVRRTEMGHVNGYVKVPVDLPYKERSSFGEFAEENFSVHGGVTFTGSLEMLGQEGYWVGFDTAHCYDWTPQWNEGEYKSVDYVKGEIKTLVSQIKKYFNLTFSTDVRSR